jgi:hypothetical protein
MASKPNDSDISDISTEATRIVRERSESMLPQLTKSVEEEEARVGIKYIPTTTNATGSEADEGTTWQEREMAKLAELSARIRAVSERDSAAEAASQSSATTNDNGSAK